MENIYKIDPKIIKFPFGNQKNIITPYEGAKIGVRTLVRLLNF
jgi:hypothetical protein